MGQTCWEFGCIPRGVLGISSDGDDQMEPKVKTQKKSLGLPAKPKKIPEPKINPQRNFMPILWPLKVPERGNATKKNIGN